MENRFQKLIEKNENIELVVHIQTREELEELIVALETLNFEYAIPLGSLREMAEQFIADDGYDGCWRISKERGVAYHPSVEHWKWLPMTLWNYKMEKSSFTMVITQKKPCRSNRKNSGEILQTWLILPMHCDCSGYRMLHQKNCNAGSKNIFSFLKI